MWVDKKYLGAFVQGHRKNARWCIDDDFSYKLLAKANAGCKESLEALEYLTKFNNEYHKAVIKKGDETAIHNTNALRKDCFFRNNLINRDTASICVWDDDICEFSAMAGSYDPTDDLIDIIDAVHKYPDPINK